MQLLTPSNNIATQRESINSSWWVAHPPEDTPGPAANSKQEREARAFAKYFSCMRDTDRGLLIHMASNTAHRTNGQAS